MITKIIDALFPWCPSGMNHRARFAVVTNIYGHQYCFHRDCIKANLAEVQDEAINGDQSERSRHA